MNFREDSRSILFASAVGLAHATLASGPMALEECYGCPSPCLIENVADISDPLTRCSLQGFACAVDHRRASAEARAECMAVRMSFNDLSAWEYVFDGNIRASNPGMADRLVCSGLSSYHGFRFSAAGRETSAWTAVRKLISSGTHGYVGCSGAVVQDNHHATTLVATYEGPARNPKAVNRHTISLIGAPRRTFTLTGLSGVLYSGQGVRMTGSCADGSCVSMVLDPSQMLSPSFPAEVWSGLVSLDFTPDVSDSNWVVPDEVATLKIFWLSATIS
eukprot:jgi/Botrbrau1/5742/Bobra.0134s0016.1